MYSQEILNEFYNPDNVGVIKGASAVGKVVSDVCGEIIKIFVSIEKDRIIDAKFQTYGCAASIAGTSFVTREIIGKTLSEVSKITSADVLALMGGVLPEMKQYIPQLIVDTLHDMIDDYRK